MILDDDQVTRQDLERGGRPPDPERVGDDEDVPGPRLKTREIRLQRLG